MELMDTLRLLHPILAVVVVFPLIGIVAYFAWQTRERRLQQGRGEKSKIPPTSGAEHVRIGRWLAGGVVTLALLGIGHPVIAKLIAEQVWQTQPTRFALVAALFAGTVAAFVGLLGAKKQPATAILAALTGAGVFALGFQDGVFRRDDEWYVSHFYLGLTVTVLMLLSLVIVQNIYQDKSGRWRLAHIVLNSLALLLLVAQGATGARDLLEIPLSWQEPYVYSCDYVHRTCPSAPPQSAAGSTP